jgi:hypothetical protein
MLQVNPNLRVHQTVYELRPTVSEDFADQRHKPTLQISSEVLEWWRQHPGVKEECRTPADAPTLCLIGRTSDGFLLVTVKKQGA